MEPTNKTLYDYCAANIEDFAHEEAHALRIMDRDRCPLSYANPRLYYAIQDAIDDYCADNEIENDFDPEDVFWAID